MSAEGWAAVIAAIGVAASVAGLVWNAMRSRAAKAIEIIAQLDAKFDSVEMRRARQWAAAYLLAPNSEPDSPLRKRDKVGLDEVFDFFESVAYLWHKKFLDTEIVWHFFSSWFLPYVHAGTITIVTERGEDNTRHSETVKLWIKMKEYEKKRVGSKDLDHILSDEKVRQFLESERLIYVPDNKH
jgi:hypothetical protein